MLASGVIGPCSKASQILPPDCGGPVHIPFDPVEAPGPERPIVAGFEAIAGNTALH
jgi:hypothetical protein